MFPKARVEVFMCGRVVLRWPMCAVVSSRVQRREYGNAVWNIGVRIEVIGIVGIVVVFH